MFVDLRCSGSFGCRSLLAKGGHPLHLFPEQAAGVSLPGDFMGGCGHGRYHDRTGNCSADVRGQVP